MPGTHVHTNVQIFIVVVMPGTHVHTTVQIFIMMMMMMMMMMIRAQKSPLKLFKLGYVNFKTINFYDIGKIFVTSQVLWV